MKLRILFFGSFQNYSVRVLETLVQHFTVSAVFTTPPKPQDRHMTLTKTPVHEWAQAHGLPVYTPESLMVIPPAIQKPDFIVVSGYGKLIPTEWLHLPKVAAVNMHPSLLPHYRGAFPAEWAILRAETKTGVTLVEMSSEFDKGGILAQQTLPISPEDTRETVYAKLYDLGSNLLVTYLPKIARGMVRPQPQTQGTFFYARRLTREDGYIPWGQIKKMISKNSDELDRKIRAFAGWPGVWTTIGVRRSLGKNRDGQASGVRKEQRVKILSIGKDSSGKPEILHVQLEGKKPVSFDIFQKNYLL